MTVQVASCLTSHQVVCNVCADVVVDLVEHAIVVVKRGQATTQVAPLSTPANVCYSSKEMTAAAGPPCQGVAQTAEIAKLHSL
jgi:hypothetical protein